MGEMTDYFLSSYDYFDEDFYGLSSYNDPPFSPITCRYCGKKNLRWNKHKINGKWVLLENKTNTIHTYERGEKVNL